MAWKIVEKFVPSPSKYPEVSIGRSGCYFNEEASKRVGLNKTHCIVMVDEELGKIGFWFFSGKPKLPNGMRVANAYIVKKAGQDVNKLVVQYKPFAKNPELFSALIGSGKKRFRFLLEREPNSEFGKDFFVVNIKGNPDVPGFEETKETS